MTEAVSIRILDREYMIGCAPEEREGLLAASRLLDARMRELRTSHRLAGIDRIAVLAALNLAHELTQVRAKADDGDRAIRILLADLNRGLERLNDRLAESE